MFRILQNSIRKTCKTGIQKLYFKLNFFSKYSNIEDSFFFTKYNILCLFYY